MNSHLRDFLAGIEARYPDDSTSMATSTWLEKNTKLRKAPFSFHRYEFQRKIADDLHPNMSVIKPSQVGLSELQLRKFLAMLKRTTAITGIYTLPNEKMRDRISQTRIKPLVDSEIIFNGPTQDKPVRHKGLYQIDDSFGYVTGSTEGDATSIPADFLFHDEIDLTEDRMVGLFQSRLQGSSYRITIWRGCPRWPGLNSNTFANPSDLVGAEATKATRLRARELQNCWTTARSKSTFPSEAAGQYLEWRRDASADNATLSTARIRLDVYPALMGDKAIVDFKLRDEGDHRQHVSENQQLGSSSAEQLLKRQSTPSSQSGLIPRVVPPRLRI